MAIFSRRTLQRLINENSEFLKSRQTKDHVNRLNKGDISVEWEVVLLNVFSKLGEVEHEKPFNKKNPDIYFISKENSEHEFLADIATVSDEGIETQNPVNEFRERLRKAISENHVEGEWQYEIGGNDETFRKGKKPLLKLPAVSRFDKEIFNEKFDDFIQSIKANSSQSRNYNIKSETISLSISYFPNKKWKMMGHFSGYKELNYENGLISNSIYNSLERKHNQLTNTDYKGKIGIIICDGGSDYFVDKADLYTKNADDIIRNFLNCHPDIAFVFSIYVKHNFGYESSTRDIVCSFYKGTSFQDSDEWIHKVVENSGSFFPEAERSATNASHLVKWMSVNRPNEGSSFQGGYEYNYPSNHMKISARVILELLSGTITQEEFCQLHDFVLSDEKKTLSNPFKNIMSKGRLITEIILEKGEDEKDDDWMIFKFGECDPAISPFRIPSVKK